MTFRDHSRPVVVGVGSRSALYATRWAAERAERRSVVLRLIHAYQASNSARSAARDQGADWLRVAREEAVQVAPDLRTEIRLVHAPILPVLVEESGNASMVVLGTRGLGGFIGLLVGSTATRLACQAQSPVIVVKPQVVNGGGQTDCGPVVLGVDGTAASAAAIAFAFDEASARGTDLVAVHTWMDSAVENSLGGTNAVDLESVRERAHRILADRLAGWPEKYPQVRVKPEVVRDRATRALLRYANNAQLVVVGSRGRGGFQSLVIGSTSQLLLQHAPCPVAVVRSDIAY
jgi:nucleotide-binding universal stress UspA family protein